METVQSVWNALLQRLHFVVNSLVPRLQSFWNSLVQSPHHIRLYVAIAAAFVVVLLVSRALFGGGRGPVTLSLDQSSSGLDQSSSGNEPSRRRASFNQSPVTGPRHGAITPAWASVTPINRAPAARCTHCDAALSASSSFCPACGYAQPMQQTGTARS